MVRSCRRGRRVCAALKIDATFEREAMTMKDGVLFGPDGKPAGHYDTDFVESYFVLPGPDGKPGLWRSTMRREGDNLVFEEHVPRWSYQPA